jgi:hypothetical protein
MYRFASDTVLSPDDKKEDADFPMLFQLNEAHKEVFLNFSRNAALGGFLLSITALSGLGPVIGAIYLTYCTVTEKYTTLFTFLPVVHVLVFINFSMQNADLIDEILAYRLAGLILILEGLAYTYISSKTDYAWKIFGWDDEEAFFSWLDTVGIFAMGYVVAGFCLAMTEFDPNELIWTLMALYLAGIGLQGFREETEAPSPSSPYPWSFH